MSRCLPLDDGIDAITNRDTSSAVQCYIFDASDGAYSSSVLLPNSGVLVSQLATGVSFTLETVLDTTVRDVMMVVMHDIMCICMHVRHWYDKLDSY